ncbi:MAG: RDD family protein [Candidatus Dormibacteraeota bacterium]|nr:RDD family protein [Candidatus Dormibacteraeota bacterium]
MIEHYAAEFEKRLVGSTAEKADWKAELVAHLHEADAVGELQDALDRLGTPAEAAEEYSRARPLQTAAVHRRLLAGILDYLPLLAISIALLVQSIIERQGGFGYSQGIAASIPPSLVFNAPGDSLLHDIGVPLALLWSIVGVGVLEATIGTTPGKRLLGLQTVSQTGTVVTLWQSLVRRLSLLFGPLMWFDWILVTGPYRQRVFERLARTRVVDDPARGRTDRG